MCEPTEVDLHHLGDAALQALAVGLVLQLDHQRLKGGVAEVMKINLRRFTHRDLAS